MFGVVVLSWRANDVIQISLPKLTLKKFILGLISLGNRVAQSLETSGFYEYNPPYQL